MMELSEIVEIKETANQNEVNELLKEGWILLSVGFVDEGVPGCQYHKYSLGLTKSAQEHAEYVARFGF